MKRLNPYLLLWFLLVAAGSTTVKCQDLSGGSCEIKGERIIFTIDLNWTSDQLQRFAQQYDLDSLVIARIPLEQQKIIIDGIEWQYKPLQKHKMEISKALDTGGGSDLGKFLNQFFSNLLRDELGPEKARPATIYGCNNFSNESSVDTQGHVKLYLAGHAGAQTISLSGSFNHWSTFMHPLSQTDQGWQIEIDLDPGKYEYRFIVDGLWSLDPNNSQTVIDKSGIENNVLYVPNHVFFLPGFSEATLVFVAGEFNGFNPNELPLQKSPAGWKLPVYLDEGTHLYKFVVDNDWILDPTNPATRDDGRGNQNSVFGIGEPTRFHLSSFTDAKQVYLCGSFNNWNETELPMKKGDTGWELNYVVGQGNHEYKFIVDGSWMPDPSNPYSSGKDALKNSFLPVNPNHKFVLEGFDSAQEVIVTGNFTGWDPAGYTMVKREGLWELPIHLKPAKYLYKFVVDGEWIIDPGNDLWEENEHGTGNSVLWIDQ